MTAIVTFVAVSFAHAQPMAIPKDQARETFQTVLKALGSQPGLQCDLRGEHSSGSAIPLAQLIKFSSSVMSLKASLPTYEFVLSKGNLSQTAVIVTLSKDGGELVSATIVSSEQVDLPAMTGDVNSQLVPLAISDCK
jgi:hypothetical protein